LVAVEVVPSPKFQLRDAIEPSLSVELSVKVAVRPLVVEVKFATGGVLTGPPPESTPSMNCAPVEAGSSQSLRREAAAPPPVHEVNTRPYWSLRLVPVALQLDGPPCN